MVDSRLLRLIHYTNEKIDELNTAIEQSDTQINPLYKFTYSGKVTTEDANRLLDDLDTLISPVDSDEEDILRHYLELRYQIETLRKHTYNENSTGDVMPPQQ